MGPWHGEISSNVTFAYCTKRCIGVVVLRGRPLTHVRNCAHAHSSSVRMRFSPVPDHTSWFARLQGPSLCFRSLDSPCAGPRNRPKSGCCGPAEATYKLFSRQWRKKKVTSGSFPLSCVLSWHNATIFLIKLSSWRIYLFVRRPVTSFLVSF